MSKALRWLQPPVPLEYTLTSKDGSQSMSNTASMVALSQEDFAKVFRLRQVPD